MRAFPLTRPSLLPVWGEGIKSEKAPPLEGGCRDSGSEVIWGRTPPERPNETGGQPGYAVRLRDCGREVLCLRRAIVRNASLTARASGKISATSGSRRTTFVPCAYRSLVTPRTAFEKSYSGRIVKIRSCLLGIPLEAVTHSHILPVECEILHRHNACDDRRAGRRGTIGLQA